MSAPDLRPPLDGMTVDRNGPEPLHDQIGRQVRDLIGSGRWPAHFRLPSEPALAAHLGVNRGTVRKALSALIADGLLVAVHGRGTFVAGTPPGAPFAQHARSIWDDIQDQGIPLVTIVRTARVERPPLGVQALFGVGPAASAARLDCVFEGPEGPVAFVITYVRADLFPRIESADVTRRSLFDIMEHDFGQQLGDTRRAFAAVSADAEVAQVLDVDIDDPVLHMEQVTYVVDGPACEYSDVWIDSSLVKVRSLVPRRPVD